MGREVTIFMVSIPFFLLEGLQQVVAVVLGVENVRVNLTMDGKEIADALGAGFTISKNRGHRRLTLDVLKDLDSLQESVQFIGGEVNRFLLNNTHGLYFLPVPHLLEHLNYSTVDSVCKVKILSFIFFK